MSLSDRINKLPMVAETRAPDVERKFALEIPEDAWEELGDGSDEVPKWTRLYIGCPRFAIAGTSMHP